ncbi:hypothetical protein N7453_008042 [Penicillium expansum]|nr:hypothetical protein N7453_008042 [Penicillium expansum]
MSRFTLYLHICFAFVMVMSVLQTTIFTLWGGAGGKYTSSGIVFISTYLLTIVRDSLVILLPMKIFVSLQNLHPPNGVHDGHPPAPGWRNLIFLYCGGQTLAPLLLFHSQRCELRWQSATIIDRPSLRSIPRSVKQPVFDGGGVYETTFDVKWGKNPSQETLRDVNDGEVRVEDAVRVGASSR